MKYKKVDKKKWKKIHFDDIAKGDLILVVEEFAGHPDWGSKVMEGVASTLHGRGEYWGSFWSTGGEDGWVLIVHPSAVGEDRYVRIFRRKR